ncbi:MAG: flippase-like domain-containing protein [Candidatus Yanofskybacteria bacterium]|nr:flippase-like domain-containing protein [Candidatus Yanofskybacteria bacterium]
MSTNGEFKPLSKPRISFQKFAFYFITLAVSVLIYLKFSEVRLIRDLFLRSNFFWLFGVIVTQVISYYFVALNYRDVLRVKDLEVGVRELFPVTFVIQFLNQALPSAGFSGQAFFVHYLKKFGLTVAEGIGRALLELATLYMAFGVFFVISSVMMFRNGIMGQHPEARFFIYAFAFFAVIALSWFLALQKRKRGKFARWMINKIHAYFENRRKKKNGNGDDNKDNGADHASHVAMIIDQFKETFNFGELKKRARPFWLAFFWQNMILLASVFTLYFLSFALDSKISFSVAFITFTLTKFLSMVAFVPGGLGVFEGGMTLILISFGVPAQPAFAMTLLLRAFTFWLPMPVGWILYRWYTHRYELEHPYEDLSTNSNQQ